jgi:SAM-dependent methyltransferase
MFMRDLVLSGLDRTGMLMPAFVTWQRLHLFGKKTMDVGPDGLPVPPPALLLRVLGAVDVPWFFRSGPMAEESIRASLERAGAPIDGMDAILDFGCGCGRVLRRWHNVKARVYGSDTSAPAIAWCRDNLPFVQASVNGLAPPLGYASDSFDLVYALSVLTHLPVALQRAWMDELHRIVRPGGYLMVTVHGDSFIDRMKPDERPLYARGECVVRRSKFPGSNLCAAFHPPSFVRNELARGWELIEHVPEGAPANGGQDLVLLRKPMDGVAAG